MKLLTKELEKKLPPLRATEGEDPKNIKIIVKFFATFSDWAWYATEYDPESRTFFGLVRGFENELGYFSLDELESVKGPFGLGIERDMYFGTERTLAEAQEKRI